MSDPSIGAIETEVAVLMRRGEATRRALPIAPHGTLDRASYLILRHLDVAGPQNVSALAAALHLDGSTVTRQVAALVRAGLVTRGPDPQDRRGAVIAATPTGLDRMSAVRKAREELYAQMLATWSEEDRRTLATLLHRLNESMEEFARTRRSQSPTADGGGRAVTADGDGRRRTALPATGGGDRGQRRAEADGAAGDGRR